MSCHIVISRYDKSTEWSNRFYDVVADAVRVIVYDKERPENPYNIPVNKGNEASVYLKYIVDFYDELPDYVFFIHDEEYSWHHEGSIIDRFIDAYIQEKSYINVNHFMMGSLYTNIYHFELLLWYNEYIEEYIPYDTLPDPDWTNGHRGAAQFLVKREAILKRPKLFYENLYRWITTSPESNFITGRFMEWSWHLFWDDL